MRFDIHKNTLENHKSASGKAIYFTHTYGGFGSHIEWFPLSQLKIGEFNDVGWASCEIPDWLLKQKQLLTYGALNGGFEELEG